LALAGFFLSCLFTGIVVLSAVVALVKDIPILLPRWALGLAIVAAIVCFLAQRRIRDSEGTLAGMVLARWGLWLSILLGVTYFVFIWVTGLALAKQANDFLTVQSDEDTGFFPHLRKAGKNRTELYQAFLLSLPTTSRGGSKADNEERMLFQYDQPGKDGEGGNITKFSKNPLVLALSKNGDTVQIEPLAVVDWNYENNSYYVVRNYRFTTPDMVIESAIPVQSSEGTVEGEQRKWFVPMNRVVKFNHIRPTPLGEKLLALRFYSKQFLDKWREEFLEGKPAIEYKESDTDWTKILPKEDLKREHVKKMLGEIFRCERKAPYQMFFITDENFADVRKVDGRIEIIHPMKMILPASDLSPNFNLELEFVTATKEPVNLDAPVTRFIEWEIRHIRLIRAAVTKKVSA